MLNNTIETYLIDNNIPLVHSTTGKSVSKLILLGARSSGWNGTTASRFTKKWFPNKPKGKHLQTYILLELGKFYCNKCNRVLDIDTAGYRRTDRDSSSTCRDCHSVAMKSHYADNSTYYKDKRARYRCTVYEQTPSWADLEKIKEIYDNCPKGYQVDHIVPLNSEIVSGLHVENNLQYLTKEDNLKKSNKFTQ